VASCTEAQQIERAMKRIISPASKWSRAWPGNCRLPKK
jgi:hypothetical protein